MPLLVVGSIAFDSIETQGGTVEDCLGGSATFFSLAASLFGDVRLVGVVGDDFPAACRKLLEERRVDTSGLVIRPGGKTFRWRGRYSADMASRETLEVHLNVLGDFQPEVPAAFRDSRFVFLGNSSPITQRTVLEQVPERKLVVADTMDLWIETQHDELLALLKEIDGLVLNDQEARLLSDDHNLVRAGQHILRLGPKFVIIKKGEHGAMFFSREGRFVMPAYPTAQVVDPTGAGDSFAGGMMGFLAASARVDPATLKRALAYGTVTASVTVEEFGLGGLQRAERAEIDARFEEYRAMISF